MKNKNIGIVGLGKLGLPMMAAFISRGFNTFGFDLNENLVNILRNKINPYKEPGIQEIIDKDFNWSERFFNDSESIVEISDYLFLIVPTPTKGMIFDVSYINVALDDICKSVNKLNKSITCIITSTLNPGDSQVLSEKTNITTNGKIKLIYSPEFIALGSVLRDMLNPDIVLLGGSDEEAIDSVYSIYQSLYLSFPEFHKMSFFEAETSKIAINTFITTKISFANTIGLFIEKVTGSRKSAQSVLNAVGGDSRIGRKYFKYGLSYGGPCFPRDNRALSAHLNSHGIKAWLPEATDQFNNDLTLYWIDRINSGGYDAMIIVGLAYKSGTDFIEESPLINIGQALSNDIDIYFIDELIEEFPSFDKVCPANLIKIKTYKKVIVLNNYGSHKLDYFKNLEIIDIWN